MRTQNLTDGKLPLWRHGRGWIGSWGARSQWEIEWKVPSGRGFGFSIGFLSFSVQLFLFDLYMHRTSDYAIDRRELSVYWMDGCLWISHPFEREMEWRRRDPWWKKPICLHVIDWLLGRQKCEKSEGVQFQVAIPMPEGCYLAIATPERFVWRRRFYVPAKVRDSVWLKIPGGIPSSGKNERGWNCGDDGLCGIGGRTTIEAVANAVSKSLRDRKAYGLDSKRTGGTPIHVCNAEAFAQAKGRAALTDRPL